MMTKQEAKNAMDGGLMRVVVCEEVWEGKLRRHVCVVSKTGGSERHARWVNNGSNISCVDKVV